MKLIHSKIWRWSEIILVFLGLPLIYYFDYIPFHKSIPLLAVFLLFLFLLIRDKSFDRKLFGLNGFKSWKFLFIRFFIFALVSTLLVFIIDPENLFILPRKQLFLWGMIMIFYPIWSAYPQELIYRSWYFHRYRSLFKREWVFIFLNALLFSFSHIIFRNWLAIVMTFFGGLMFAYTYRRSNSLMTVFIEHLLYGNYIFTVGIGQYFYAPTTA
jgi:membrane protease YdiL (CAAX protease family)